jgi:hypothetical protein
VHVEVPMIISVDDHVLHSRTYGRHGCRPMRSLMALTCAVSAETSTHPAQTAGVQVPIQPSQCGLMSGNYDDMIWPLSPGCLASGYLDDDLATAITCEQVLCGTTDRSIRLVDFCVRTPVHVQLRTRLSPTYSQSVFNRLSRVFVQLERG